MTAEDERPRVSSGLLAWILLAWMAVLAGGASLRESVTIDEVAHIGAGVSYLQKLDLRMNPEHPPLPKVLAALPLVLRGVRADYYHISWTISDKFFPAFLGQCAFGEWLLERWNQPNTVLPWGAPTHAASDSGLGMDGIRVRAAVGRPMGWAAVPQPVRQHACIPRLWSNCAYGHSGDAFFPA